MRIDKIGAEIVAACIDQKVVKDEGIEYVIQNQQFAHEILNIVNGLKERIGSKLKVDVNEIVEPEVCDIVEEDEEVDEPHSPAAIFITSWGNASGSLMDAIIICSCKLGNPFDSVLHDYSSFCIVI